MADQIKPKNDAVLEYEKNDQLISRSESELRIFIILSIVSSINNLILVVFTIILSRAFTNDLKFIDVDIPVQIMPPFLKVIYKNGSVYSSYVKNRSYISSEYNFDLPPDADYYYYFEYRDRHSYIHGYGNRNHFHQTFKNIHRKSQQRKHKFSSKKDFDSQYLRSGHNSSLVPIGHTLTLFGGAIHEQSGNISYFNTYFKKIEKSNLTTEEFCDADISHCNIGNTFSTSFFDCKCRKNDLLHFWSMKKESFIPSTITLPQGFGFLTGCTASLDRNKVILIGGHHVKKLYEIRLHEYVIKYPPNDQVVEFDFMKKKWSELPNVPLSNVREF